MVSVLTTSAGVTRPVEAVGCPRRNKSRQRFTPKGTFADVYDMLLNLFRGPSSVPTRSEQIANANLSMYEAFSRSKHTNITKLFYTLTNLILFYKYAKITTRNKKASCHLMSF